MPRQSPTKREFTILAVGTLQHAFKGYYLECNTDIGIVAIWGSIRNTDNIRTAQLAEKPFKVQAFCINPNPNYPQHDLWVPERYPITIIPDEPTEATVSVQELAEWRRCIIRMVEQLEPEPSPEKQLSTRIHRLSREGYIPRDIKALMLAITESRNLAEYESKLPSGSHSKALKNAWQAILQWAQNKGLIQDPEI